MKNFKEIIPVSVGGGKKGDLDCQMGKITISEVKALVACP